ncbi:MAG TPA: hypothetical protein PLZ57_15490 [Pseudobdellovibrionaceae bacterium]|nr:hypothetical protein [Pseudobdellovibrionaceae bacterium]
MSKSASFPGRIDIEEFAKRLQRLAKGEALEAPSVNAEFSEYERLAAQALTADSTWNSDAVALATRGFHFRPIFLRYGLQQVASVDERVRQQLIRALAELLSQNAEYLAGQDQDSQGDEASRLEVKFSMHLLFQLPEMGIDLGDVMLMIKSDLRSPELIYAWRSLAEEGPQALLDSSLFNAEEKLLWADVFQGQAEAWLRLREHVASQHGIELLLID